ncbi:MAG: hypothetical protein ACTSX6_14705 [Candidatus Heimdallarchaeaceae archaeon]
MKKAYKYNGTFSIIVYEDGKSIQVLPGMTVELSSKPNKYFVEVVEESKNEITKDVKKSKKKEKR